MAPNIGRLVRRLSFVYYQLGASNDALPINMSTQLLIHSWMVSLGYPLLGLLRLGLCLYGVARTPYRATFWLWSAGAFLSLVVALFAAVQQRLIAGVGAFPSLYYLCAAVAGADYAALRLVLLGLLILLRMTIIHRQGVPST